MQGFTTVTLSDEEIGLIGAAFDQTVKAIGLSNQPLLQNILVLSSKIMQAREAQLAKANEPVSVPEPITAPENTDGNNSG